MVASHESAFSHENLECVQAAGARPMPLQKTPTLPDPPSFVQQETQSTHVFLDICCGSSRPLSAAMLALGAPVLSFDILCSARDDLLDDRRYELLLKLSASGVVAYAGASPSCSQYSRLKLRNDGGPGALRTPEHLSGRPGLGTDELQQVQESSTMLFRAVMCLQLVFLAGGHVHLEQPTNAMSWLEPFVQSFLQLISAFCVSVAACHFGRDWNKSWMFACSFPPLKSLACSCEHSQGSHVQVQGQRDDQGQFLSRQTACYPESLAQAWATLVFPLCAGPRQDLRLDDLLTFLPVKPRRSLPCSLEDGGGLPSQPDWSAPDRMAGDSLGTLRKDWLSLVLCKQLHKKFVAHFASGTPSQPFCEEELQPFRESLNSFLHQQHCAVDWSIREHQPFALKILSALSHIQHDPDVHLFSSLERGVSTGFQGDIPPSNCFPVRQHSSRFDDTTPLSAHMQNWTSAESDLELTRELVQKEVDEGWVFAFDGTLADAQQQFPVGVSIGKLGIATSPGRAPRLVVDNSVSGLNARCWIPEQSTLPSAKDVIRCWPLRELRSHLLGFSLDIKAAHKRIVLHQSEWGLVGFSLDGRLYFYRVTPFGASFSAMWWARVGAFFLRTFHRLIWFSHVGMLYVDDFIFYQDATMMPLTACLICILCQLTQVPISWAKCELSRTIKWIGWIFHLNAGFIEIPPDKLGRIQDFLRELQKHSNASRRLLEKFIGLAMWITQLFPYMRIWLHHLYKDLYSIPGTLFSVDPSVWSSVAGCLRSDLTFHTTPLHTAIPVDGKLISVRHQQVQCLDNLTNLKLSERRIWLRIRDPTSQKRKLSSASKRVLNMFSVWLSALPPLRPLRPKQYWPGQAAADACASGQTCQIGGFVSHPNGQVAWFSEEYWHSDFEALGLSLNPEMQRSISSFEALAQLALLIVIAKTNPSFRIPICLRSLSDNTGAEAGSNKMFCASEPLCFFLEKLCLFAALTRMEMDVTHIPGHANVHADALSRWNGQQDPPLQFHLQDRIALPLRELWTSPRSVSLHPPHTFLLWRLPS